MRRARRFSLSGNAVKGVSLFTLLFCVLSTPLFAQGPLSPVTVTPGSITAGTASIHTISFTTTTGIPADGKIVVLYPGSFDETSVIIASSTTMDGSFSVAFSGDSIVVTRTSGTATLGGSSESLRLANVTNSTTAGSAYQTTVWTKESDDTIIDTGISSNFSVTAGALDNFNVVLAVAGNKTAGTAFNVNLTARDTYGNTVTTFTGTVSISDGTGSITPTTSGSFVAGQLLTQSVTITTSAVNNTITVVNSGKSGVTSTFNVDPAGVSSFDISSISSQTAGTGFGITMTARDAYDNVATGFTGSVTITYSGSGALTPGTSGSFTSGTRSETVSINRAESDVRITVDDGSSHTGTSNYFNVNPGSLDHFTIANIADQATGVPFAITVTAQDLNNNTVTGFSGTGNTVNITHSGGGSISPLTSGTFSNGVWTGNVTIVQTQVNDRITVTRTSGGAQNGQSNQFNVNPSSVDHFVFSAIGGTQTAGVAFSVTITAQDVNNNTVTTYAGTANLADVTGTTTPQQVTFVGGIWTGNVTVTQSYTGDRLTVTGNGKSSQSGLFNVLATSVSRFKIDDITSPQTAGAGFGILITALDNYDNVAAGFTGTVGITYSGSDVISPGLSSNFTAGTLTQSVTIEQAENDVQITVTRTGGIETGTSNLFNVVHASLDHFAIGNIAGQAAGLPFSIMVTAQDAYDNTVLTFTGAGNLVNISHSGSGSISPTSSGTFLNGVWTGNVTIVQTQTGDQISVQRAGGSETGTSNAFNVDPSSVDHFVFSAVSSPQTVGVAFVVTITAQDVNNNTVTAYTGTANLTDATGTTTPQQVTFSGGIWTGNVTITKSRTGDYLTISGNGKTSQSGTFNVQPATVARFEIGAISSPKVAGGGFDIAITARDAFDNVATGFTGTVGITYSGSGTITPVTSGNFTAGLRTQSVTINRAQSDVQITVTRTGGTETGTSNYFNVMHGNLHHFAIGTIAGQAAGLPFSITATAQDANNNTVLSFSGTGNTVNIGHTGGGAISPTVSGNFLNGVWTGNVTIVQTQVNDRVTVTRTGGGETGQSNQFNVDPNSVDHFVFSVIGGTQTAGSSFSITVTAQDVNNNTVTGYNGTANLTDATGTTTPQQVTFSGGTWTGLVIITKSGTGNRLTVTGNGKSSPSGTFNVQPATVSYFEIATITSPQNAGTGFSVTLTARDTYNNLATSFSGAVGITYSGSGTISPSLSGNFTSGVRTETVFITRSQNDLYIRVSDGVHTGTSNLFNVISGPLDHFVIANVGDQMAGDPFTVSIRAEDFYNNIATSFTSTVDFTDLTTTIRPVTSGAFVSGLWSGGVTISQAYIGNRITVTRTGGGPTGNSNTFNVNAPPGLRMVSITPSQTSVTAGQTQNWTLSLSVQNLASSFATLDSVRMRFMLEGANQTDYTLVLPTILRNSGSPILAGGTTDQLTVTVDRTGAGWGNVTVEAKVYFLDSGTGRTVSAEDFTGISVQDSARLVILQVTPQQEQVSTGQQVVWNAYVVLLNAGGSDVVLDSGPPNTNISFSIGAGWQFTRPTALKGGGWTLSGGERDTLVYIVTRSGEGATGNCIIHATTRGTETNTGRILTENTQDAGMAQILLETPAALRIVSLQNIAMNAPYVNRSQPFSVRLMFENTGQDGSHDILVSLISDGLSIFPSTIPVTSLAGGERKTIDVAGTAGHAADALEIITADIEGYSDNTNRHLLSQNAVDDTARAVVQDPAVLSLSSMRASKAEVLGGQVDPWTVKVAVRNTGVAVLKLDSLEANDLSFWISGVYQSDYVVSPPTALKGGGLTLRAGRTDTLIYRITTTGRLGGNVEIRAQVTGRDRNNNQVLSASRTTTIIVRAEMAFRIISTRIETLNDTEAGNGYVNTRQGFQVVVMVENGLGETLKDIAVRLETAGRCVIPVPQLFIPRMTPTQWDSVTFNVIADSLENLKGETFTSKLISATLETSGLSAPVGPAIDSTAIVFVQSPALLSLALEVSNANGIFSTGQVFTLKATLANLGSGSVDTTGILHLTLPVGYTLMSPDDDASVLVGTPVVWSIRAPNQAMDSRTIYVTVSHLPLEINTGEEASITEQTVSVNIITIVSSLISSLSISSPEGAKDDTLSSSQSFVVKASVQWINVKDITAQIVLPASYKTSDNAIKSVITSDVVWTVTAPDIATGRDAIQVITRGVDALQGTVQVVGNTASLFVITVARADLYLDFSIDSPDDALDGSVSLGQEFVVRAEIENHGDADTVGLARVTLSPLPVGYVTSDAMSKDLVNGMATWKIRAPLQPSAQAVNIEANLSAVPQDENTNAASHVSRANDTVPMTTEGSWLAVIPRSLSQTEVRSVIPGQGWIKFMVLELDNRGISGSSRIIVGKLKFVVEDRFGMEVTPTKALSALYAVNEDDSTIIYGMASPLNSVNPAEIPFANEVVIPIDQNVKVAVYGTIAQDAETQTVQLNLLNGDFVEARDYVSGISIPVNDISGEELANFRSDVKRIFYPGEEVTFKNFPNPFGEPGKETTTLIYYLEKNTDIELRLFTLTGKLVWSRFYAKNDPQGSEGLHSSVNDSVVWDGTNDQGLKVLNGVYILIMQTKAGEMFKTKVAFIK